MLSIIEKFLLVNVALPLISIAQTSADIVKYWRQVRLDQTLFYKLLEWALN